MVGLRFFFSRTAPASRGARIPLLNFMAISAVAATLLVSGCDQDGIRVRGFVLPEGDPAKGELAFVQLDCTACHTVADTELTQPEDAAYSVPLGGKVIQVKHYGDLLTSIVHPDHRVFPRYVEDAEDEADPASPMPEYIDIMSVEQLIDVVAFLHGKYEKIPTYGGKYYYYP